MGSTGAREAEVDPATGRGVESLLAEDGARREDDPIENLPRAGADRHVDGVLGQDDSA